jgi:site-specific recombinase XerD
LAKGLRCLLRFLHVEGVTPTGLASSVPGAAGWRLASLPKAIDGAVVTRLLASCDPQSAAGRRDLAVLTLLARFGLRVGEVATLELADIDWRTGEVLVRGKGNRQDRLPLPVDVGEAVVGWLRRRPACGCSRVITTVRAPLGPITDGGVSAIVRRASLRCGLEPLGAHRLRHTVATELLHFGAGLNEIGLVLRHHRLSTTAIYAKVDRSRLVTIAQPWPGGAA